MTEMATPLVGGVPGIPQLQLAVAALPGYRRALEVAASADEWLRSQTPIEPVAPHLDPRNTGRVTDEYVDAVKANAAAVADAQVRRNIVMQQKQAAANEANQIVTGGIDLVLRVLQDALSQLLDDAKTIVDELDGATTPAQAIDADAGAAWKELTALADDYQSIRQGQTWLMTRAPRQIWRSCEPDLPGETHANLSFIRNIDDLWPDWRKGAPNTTTVFLGDGTRPNAVGIGCPRCSIIGVSQREARLRVELAAAGLPVEHNHARITVDGRRPIQADIVMPALRLVVEYDGSYYHAKKTRADRAQTAALKSANWTVVRVREKPLPSIGGHEVFVSPTEPMKSLALKVLQHLKTLGYRASMHDEYQQDPNVWAEREANEALNKARTRSLATENPLLAEEFDQAKNGVGPEAVHPGSNEKYWWRCRICGHEWKSVLASRVAGPRGQPRGCPRCGVARRAAQRAVPLPGNSFAELFRDVANEWHPTRNGTLTPSQVSAASNKVVWWQCPRGHEWQARVAFRREYGRCRKCRRDGALPYRLDKP